MPAAWWAGGAYGRRAGGIAAAVAALCPFLTYYAQETRMYALAALLSVLAAGAFAADRRRLLALALVALLYTHTWGIFVVAAMVLARAAQRLGVARRRARLPALGAHAGGPGGVDGRAVGRAARARCGPPSPR